MFLEACKQSVQDLQTYTYKKRCQFQEEKNLSMFLLIQRVGSFRGFVDILLGPFIKPCQPSRFGKFFEVFFAEREADLLDLVK